MTERIDHAAEARTIIANTQPHQMGHTGNADWIALAQVHATLALIEQQRIANLIAWMDGWDSHDVPAEELERLKKALGLT